MEFELGDWLATSEIHRRLDGQLPRGLRVMKVESADPRTKAQVSSLEYRVKVRGVDPAELERRVEGFRQSPEVLVRAERKGEVTELDLKESVADLERSGPDLVFEIDATGRKVPRPEFVLKGLGFDPDAHPEAFGITRTRVNLVGPLQPRGRA